MPRLQLLLATLAALFLGAGAPAAAQDFVVVVRAELPVATLTRTEVANLFLKRATRLPGGHAAAPVDQPKSSPAREAFSRAVLGRSASAVVIFWQRQIFAGKDVPPPERADDAEVLAFVRSHPGAIGYVSPGTPLGVGVKAVGVR